MKLLLLFFCAGLLLCTSPSLAAPTPFARNDKLALRGATPNRTVVPRFDRFELSLDFSAAYENPFNPDEVQVGADFTSPQGQIFKVSGFLAQNFARKLENDAEKIEANEQPRWLLRFAPNAVGTWKYRVWGKDKSGEVSLAEATFRCTASEDLGFVRRSANNSRVFAFENDKGVEKPFFAVGENMGWPGKRGTYDFDDWLNALGKAGGNWMRIWMSSWNCALEWSREGRGEWRNGEYHGVGVYSLGNAWKLDQILDSAAQNKVYVMVCFGTYGEFKSGGFFNEGQWKANPYNIENGGPCKTPEEFWTNETARKLYKQRLRYIVARYGWRTGVHSWEFWNEAEAPTPWIEEMAKFLKSIDPYKHLVSTTYGTDAIWKLPEIDFTQTHHYGTGNIADTAPVARGQALEYAKYNKPHLLAEFGIDWRDSDAKYDPDGKGINFHNGIWAGALSGDGGSPMLWWWDNYVHPKKLYGHFTPLRRFADLVPWTDGAWQPLEMAPPQSAGDETFSDLVIPTTAGWGKAKSEEFQIGPLGVKGSAPMTQYLYSAGKADLRSVPRFKVNFARPGQFSVRVDEVSTKTTLRFLLDGKPIRDVVLDPVPPADPKVKPEYESTELRPQWNSYQARFNKGYAIEVPAGQHEVGLDVIAGDWLSLGQITLTNYRSSNYPDLHLYALGNGKGAIFWAHNAAHNWKNVLEKKQMKTVRSSRTSIPGLPEGIYNIEWWDTWKGVAISRQTGRSENGNLPINLPEITTDVAARIWK
ncbi:MAG TPA: DUF5060 domain-containing protein [Abditibacteriaceae bacterium]